MEADLGEAVLSDSERELVARFVRLASHEIGADLQGVWLFGSRARGEVLSPDSDVDVLVVARGGMSATGSG